MWNNGESEGRRMNIQNPALDSISIGFDFVYTEARKRKFTFVETFLIFKEKGCEILRNILFSASFHINIFIFTTIHFYGQKGWFCTEVKRSKNNFVRSLN